MPIITLTTDFGLADEYVGVMKGVILSKSPKARLVDLTHAVPPYNISMAAYLISSQDYVMKGTSILFITREIVPFFYGGAKK